MTAGVLQTQAEWPCLSHNQHLTSEAGSVVEEVTLGNLLRQYNPAMQSPSDRGTNLLQGLLLGVESDERQRGSCEGQDLAPGCCHRGARGALFGRQCPEYPASPVLSHVGLDMLFHFAFSH